MSEMNKNLYLDLHVLQTVPPSCINRDDTGSPKTAVYGGVNRARVSSQAWKRSIRMMFRDLFDENQLGLRTRNIKDLLLNKMKEMDPTKDYDVLEKLAGDVLTAAKIKSSSDKKDVLFFVSAKQIEALAATALEYLEDDLSKKEKEKKYKTKWEDSLNQNPSIDIMLFGRMAASDPKLNCDAAAQVAHCLSTHVVSNEYDYFTAVDDCGLDDNAGAGHLGTVEFNSSTLYRYSTVNIAELYEKDLSVDEVCDVIRGFVEAFISAMPTGKQNTFANRTLPCFIYVALRDDQPINMAGAFEKPVTKGNGGYEANSINAFLAYSHKVYENFAEKPQKSWVVCLDELPMEAERVKKKELIVQVIQELKNLDGQKGE